MGWNWFFPEERGEKGCDRGVNLRDHRKTRQAGEPAGAESAACFSFLFSFYLYIKKYLDGRGGTIEAKAIDRAALQLRAVEK